MWFLVSFGQHTAEQARHGAPLPVFRWKGCYKTENGGRSKPLPYHRKHQFISHLFCPHPLLLLASAILFSLHTEHLGILAILRQQLLMRATLAELTLRK